MGIVFGFLCLIFFCVLSAKAITRRCHWEKADRFLMKFHKFISGLLVISCFLHVIFVVPVLKNRSILVIITGIASVIFMILVICFCHMIKDKKKKIWWHRVLTIIMAICIAGHIVTWIVDFNDYQQKVSEIVIEDIELGNVKDGVYEGEYDAGYIYARIEVEIRNNEIVSITLLEHRNERGKPAESILDEVVAKQKIDVDAVSGATNSSNVIKKAIENAVKNAHAK